MNLRDHWKKITAGLLVAALLLVAGVCLATKTDVAELRQIIREETNPWIFGTLFLALPLVGFPLSAFLMALGARYGLWWGLAVAAAVIPVHITAAHLVTRGFLRKPVKRLMRDRIGYEIPGFSGGHRASAVFWFVALPVVPYAAKLYLAPLAGLPLLLLLAVSWPVQTLLALPFLGIADSIMEMNLPVLAGFGLAFVVLYGGLRWMSSRRGGEVQ